MPVTEETDFECDDAWALLAAGRGPVDAVLYRVTSQTVSSTAAIVLNNASSRNRKIHPLGRGFRCTFIGLSRFFPRGADAGVTLTSM